MHIGGNSFWTAEASDGSQCLLGGQGFLTIQNGLDSFTSSDLFGQSSVFRPDDTHHSSFIIHNLLSIVLGAAGRGVGRYVAEADGIAHSTLSATPLGEEEARRYPCEDCMLFHRSSNVAF